MPVAGRSAQRRPGLGQTNSPAIQVSQRGGKFSHQGQPVGGEGLQRDPDVEVYANESA